MDIVIDRVRDRGAHLEGHFKLSCGRHSPRFLHCARILGDHVLAGRLGREQRRPRRTPVGVMSLIRRRPGGPFGGQAR